MWKPFKRGDKKPWNAVHAGETCTDDHVFVGRSKKILAKSIWTSTSKSWDYLVSGISGSRQSGEMLLTNENCNWVKIKRGDIFPDNAIYSGLDVKGDKLLVGKTLGDGSRGKSRARITVRFLPQC